MGALGAAIAGAVAAGCYPSYAETVAAMTKTARVHQPDPVKRDLYDANYTRYQKVLDALGPVWGDLS